MAVLRPRGCRGPLRSRVCRLSEVCLPNVQCLALVSRRSLGIIAAVLSAAPQATMLPSPTIASDVHDAFEDLS